MLAFADKEPRVVKNYFDFFVRKELGSELFCLRCIVPMLDLDESAVTFVSLEILFFFEVDDGRGENIKLFNDCAQAIMRDVGKQHRYINCGELSQDFVTFELFDGHMFSLLEGREIE